MKNSIYLILSTIFICTFSAFIFNACVQIANSKNPTSQTQIIIPELLERNEKIQLGKEWDFVQNFYANQKTVLSKNPNDNEAKLNLAQLFIKEARVTGEHGHYYPAALSLVDEIIQSNPKKPDLIFRSLMTKAGVQLSLHEFEAAKITGEQAVRYNPHNAQILGVLVDANVELGDYKKAVEIADRMISIKPDIRSYSRVSYLREIHGDVKGAIEAMTLAVKSGYPGYEETAWAMLTLGELLAQYGDLDKAQKVFEAILETREDYPFAIAAIGDIYFQQKDYKTAESKIKEAINIIPEVGFYVQLAHLYKIQNRTEELENLEKEIFEMLQDDVDHGHNMNLEYADIYLNLIEDSDKAIEYANIEYQKRPKNIDVNRQLALIYKKKNDFEKTNLYTTAASITNSLHPDLIALQN